MGDLFCGDYKNFALKFDEDGPFDYCLYKMTPLSDLAMMLARNVPDKAMGHCPGFIPDVAAVSVLIEAKTTTT